MPATNAYDPLIAAAAARWSAAYGVQVPAPIVKAIVRAESGFDPRALRVEPDGRRSLGLMQVLEGTARELGLRDPQRLYDPAVAIHYGTKYLARQLRRYRGDVPRAVSAYNAGTATHRNASYVRKVLGFARTFGYAAAGVGALVLAGVVVWLLLRRG